MGAREPSWSERIRDLEMSEVTGRRKETMKARIVALSVENGVLSSYTAFVVVETRSGERRATGLPDTRVVPVSVPAGWDMFKRAPQQQTVRARGISLPAGLPMVAATSFGAMAGGPGAPPSPAPRKKSMARKGGGLLGKIADAFRTFLLSTGNESDRAEAYRQFRGRYPGFDAEAYLRLWIRSEDYVGRILSGLAAAERALAAEPPPSGALTSF